MKKYLLGATITAAMAFAAYEYTNHDVPSYEEIVDEVYIPQDVRVEIRSAHTGRIFTVMTVDEDLVEAAVRSYTEKTGILMSDIEYWVS